VKVAVFTAVNAVGCLVDREGRAVRGHLDPDTGERRRVGEVYDMGGAGGQPQGDPPPGNTTLSVVVTNQPMDLRPLRQLARQVHSSMARAIDPFHTMHDGDVLYAVTTNSYEGEPLHHQEIAHIASELAWDAVLRSF
jgi:L-aminopeptidase/D-esterase-like protein